MVQYSWVKLHNGILCTKQYNILLYTYMWYYIIECFFTTIYYVLSA